MARPGCNRYERPEDSDTCAVPGCSQPLDLRGARCRHHRVHGDEVPYVPTQRRRPSFHGEYLHYRRGCRCEQCRAANAKRAATLKAARP